MMEKLLDDLIQNDSVNFKTFDLAAEFIKYCVNRKLIVVVEKINTEYYVSLN